MEIIYSSHAVQRMLERNISTLVIESILNFPDGIISQSKDKKNYFKKLKGRKDNLIAVVAVAAVKNFKDQTEIITVMINFEVKK